MKDEDKFLIHENIKSGNTLIASQLINENPQLNLRADEDGRCPIHWAVSMNNFEMVKLLGSKGNLDIDELIDDSGWTAIHIACSIGNEEMLDYLMKLTPTPDVNLKTNQGVTPLHLAILKKNLGVIKKLIIEYKCKCNVKDKNGYTPLQRASSIGLLSIITLLNEKGKVNLNSTDNYGWTALHHALAEGKGDAAKLLIDLGADKEVNSPDGLPIDVCVDEKIKKYVFQ